MRTPLLATATVSLFAFAAHAHIELEFPTPRYADQKSGPCGAAVDVRGSNVTAFPPGATVTVRWRETIDHPAHYRISFDDDGQDFYVPTDFEDIDESHPGVLKDGIADLPLVSDYQQEVTLPDIECTNCTLQLIQMMKDKPPYGDGNDIYHQCADLELREGADPAGESPALGCACVDASPTTAAFGLLVPLLIGALFPRRRRATSAP